MTTLDPFIASYMKSRRALGIYNAKSQRVVTPRLTSLGRHFGNRPLHHLTPDAIELWLESLLRRCAQNSRACYLVSVRQFTAWLKLERHIDHDPCVPIPAVIRVRPLPRSQSAEAVARILGACTTDRERAIIWLMVGMGLRRMEVAGLRWEHYDDRAELLDIREAKNSKERVLPVTTEVAAALQRLRGGGMTGPIIANETTGDQLSVERVGWLAARVMRRAGVKVRAYDGISGHALRHTAASDVLDHCGDLRVVQTMLGHENLATTAIYLRRKSASQMREAMGGRTYSTPDPKAA